MSMYVMNTYKTGNMIGIFNVHIKNNFFFPTKIIVKKIKEIEFTFSKDFPPSSGNP
jgi:hypothetical protein